MNQGTRFVCQIPSDGRYGPRKKANDKILREQEICKEGYNEGQISGRVKVSVGEYQDMVMSVPFGG